MENDTSYLPFFLTEDLYLVNDIVRDPTQSGIKDQEPESLTDLKEKNVKKESNPVIRYKGENKQGILIIIENQSDEYLNPDDEKFLLKILQAVELSLEDVALVNITHYKENPKELSNLPHTIAISFTKKISLLDEMYNIDAYTIINHSDRQLLLADPLLNISKDKEQKVKLWQQLKILFNK